MMTKTAKNVTESEDIDSENASILLSPSEQGESPIPVFEVPIDAMIKNPVGVFMNAASGSGKSTLLRYMMESTHSQIHQIIIDSEGEFHTLRTDFDYLLVGGTGADIPVHVSTAAQLTARLMEFSVSTIVDISELKQGEQRAFVAAFLEQLMETPTHLWHPVLVFLDELKRFAPQSGNSVSSAVVADLQARGRKRGFIPVYATQSFEGVDKDAISEMQNRILGTIDVDMRRKRQADDFGIDAKGRLLLKQMPVGQFFVRGPAFGREPRLVQVPMPQTVKPAFGSMATPPTPSEAMAQLLTHFADVVEVTGDEESDGEPSTMEGLRKQVASLKRKLAESPTPARVEVPVEKIVERTVYVPAISEEDWAQACVLRDAMLGHGKDLINMAGEITARLREAVRLDPSQPEQAETLSMPDLVTESPVDKEEDAPSVSVPSLMAEEIRMLSALAGYPGNRLTISQLEVLARVSYGNAQSTWGAAVTNLKDMEMIKTSDRYLILTAKGKAALVEITGKPLLPPPSSAIRLWEPHLRAKAFQMFRWLMEIRPRTVTGTQLARRFALIPGNKQFNAYLRDLNQLDLIKRDNQDNIRAEDDIP